MNGDKKPKAKKPAAKKTTARKPATRTRTTSNGGDNGGARTRPVYDDDRDYYTRRRRDNDAPSWLAVMAGAAIVLVAFLLFFSEDIGLTDDDLIGDDDNGGGTNVQQFDSDGDGFTDAYENSHGTDPNSSTTDNGTAASPTPAATQNQSGNSSSEKPGWLGSQCKLAPSISAVSEKIKTSFTAPDSLAYPDMIAADPNRSGPLFPDTNAYGHEPRAGYDVSFQNGDYFQDCTGDTDVPQYYWRVETTGYFWIPKSQNTPEDIVCMASEKKGCALIYINHFGPTMKINGVYDDNGFTVAGPTWDLSTPDKVTSTAQDLVDHYVYRMIYGDAASGRNDGTNCGVIDGCNSVEWHVVVYGNGELQKHWTGLYAP